MARSFNVLICPSSCTRFETNCRYFPTKHSNDMKLHAPFDRKALVHINELGFAGVLFGFSGYEVLTICDDFGLNQLGDRILEQHLGS